MNEYVARISSYGNDVRDQEDKNLRYSSIYSTPKIFKRGHVSITTSGSGTGTAVIPHGFGYAPAFYVFRVGTASFSFLDASSYSGSFHPAPSTSTPWINYHQTSDAYTNRTNLVIYIEGENSTTYNFVYYIFVDEAEANQASVFQPENDYGLKVSSEDTSALSTQDQKIQYSSEYGSLQFYREMTTDFGGISLPALSGDHFDENPEEGTYVDFMHELDYPPFFLAYAENDNNERILLPDAYTGTLFGDAEYALTTWCDKEKIRITFYRKAHYSSSGPSFSTEWTESEFDVRVFVFAENLDLQ